MPNEFLSTGLLLMLGGSLLAYFRWIPGAIRAYVLRRFSVTVEIYDHDPSFYWLTAWLGTHMGAIRTCGEWTITTYTMLDDDSRSYDDQANAPQVSGKKRKISVDYAPAPGWHMLRFHDKRIVVQRVRTEKDNGSRKGHVDHFVLRVWGQDGRDVIQAILNDGRNQVEGSEVSRFLIFQGHYTCWETLASCRPRPLESVVLADGIMESLLGDIRKFLASRDWYADRGIPYRRGYLLYGSPGNGKSSVVSAVAGFFGMDIYVAPISSSWMDDNHLSALIRQVPAGGILLMEDIDCAFPVSREQSDENQGPGAYIKTSAELGAGNHVTLSGLLNVIDGIAATEGRILFMTSNRPEVLDPAILRKGRVDKTIELREADYEQASRLYTYFYKGSGVNGEQAAEFANLVLGRQSRSMADLQGMLLDYPDDPHGIIATLKAENNVLHKSATEQEVPIDLR